MVDVNQWSLRIEEKLLEFGSKCYSSSIEDQLSESDLYDLFEEDERTVDKEEEVEQTFDKVDEDEQTVDKEEDVERTFDEVEEFEQTADKEEEEFNSDSDLIPKAISDNGDDWDSCQKELQFELQSESDTGAELAHEIEEYLHELLSQVDVESDPKHNTKSQEDAQNDNDGKKAYNLDLDSILPNYQPCVVCANDSSFNSNIQLTPGVDPTTPGSSDPKLVQYLCLLFGAEVTGKWWNGHLETVPICEECRAIISSVKQTQFEIKMLEDKIQNEIRTLQSKSLKTEHQFQTLGIYTKDERYLHIRANFNKGTIRNIHKPPPLVADSWTQAQSYPVQTLDAETQTLPNTIRKGKRKAKKAPTPNAYPENVNQPLTVPIINEFSDLLLLPPSTLDPDSYNEDFDKLTLSPSCTEDFDKLALSPACTEDFDKLALSPAYTEDFTIDNLLPSVGINGNDSPSIEVELDPTKLTLRTKLLEKLTPISEAASSESQPIVETIETVVGDDIIIVKDLELAPPPRIPPFEPKPHPDEFSPVEYISATNEYKYCKTSFSKVPNGKYQCSLCPQSEPYMLLGIKRHIIQIHTNHYVCPICKFRFYNCNPLKQHYEREHRNPVYVDCPTCGKPTLEEDLEAHKTTHWGVKDKMKSLAAAGKLQCDQCSKFFSSVRSYTVHQSLHESELPFKCTQCTQQFGWQYRLDAHMKQAHKGKGVRKLKFPCTLCLKVYSRGDHLNRHLKDFHSEKRTAMLASGEPPKPRTRKRKTPENEENEKEQTICLKWFRDIMNNNKT